MNTLSTALALALGLCAAGCADAHAQPRRDAGTIPRWGIPSRAAPLRNPFGTDGGVPAAFLTEPAYTSDIEDTLARATATSAGPPPPAPDREAMGTIGSPAYQGHFADPERLVGVPPRDAHIWLTVAEGWVLRCLERVPRATPFDAPVRFTVALDGTVADVTAEGVSEAAVQCLVEGLGHARFTPVARPGEVVARYRFTVRGRPLPGSGVVTTTAPGGRVRPAPSP